MNETDTYLFDLQGFLVVRDVLSADEVRAANEAIDQHADGITERVGEASLSSDSTTMKGETGRGDLGGLLGLPPGLDLLVGLVGLEPPAVVEEEGAQRIPVPRGYRAVGPPREEPGYRPAWHGSWSTCSTSDPSYGGEDSWAEGVELFHDHGVVQHE